MSEFEFFTVAITVILALGIGRLLDGIAPAFTAGRRYWVHVGWIAQKFINHVMWWWSMWTARGFEWNLAWFAFSLIGPSVLYLQANALVTQTPTLVTSWREHFYEIRPWFFAGNVALCSILLIGRASGPDPMLATVPIGLSILAGLAVVGIVSSNPRIHAVLVVCALVIQILGFGTAIFEAGTV